MRYAMTSELLPHQQDATAKMLPSKVGGLFMDLGTGKSITALALAHLRDGKWDRLIWSCPVSAKETIRYEALRHTSLGEGDVYVFNDRTNARTLPLDKPIYILGIESLSDSMRVVGALDALLTEQSFVICDESTYIKNHRANRTQRLTAMAARTRYRLILSGTPLTNGVVDLYAQMKFLSPLILNYPTFNSFASNHLEYELAPDTSGVLRNTGRIVRAHNERYLATRIEPYVYQVKKDECLTLPPKLYDRAWCPMTYEQAVLYEQAKNEWLTLDLPDWDGKALYQLFTALQTISCGWWNRRDPVTGEQELLTVKHERLDLLRGVLGQIPDGEKVIIWAKYRRAIQEIVELLGTDYGPETVAQFHGGLNEQQRNAELARWRRADGARFLVATQSAGSHALTLTEAAYAVFYADAFKYGERIQAEDRMHRIGQTRRPVYISLGCSNTIDTRIADALARKADVLRVFQDQVDKCRRNSLRARAEQLVREL